MSQMPDKIWLHKDTKYNTEDIVCGYQYEFAQEIECEGIENFVEYVPVNAFIDKACNWLADNYSKYITTNGLATIFSATIDFDTIRMIEDFKKAIEE